jgi:acetoin utilization deacetylase AcuC-like enzyme
MQSKDPLFATIESNPERLSLGESLPEVRTFAVRTPRYVVARIEKYGVLRLREMVRSCEPSHSAQRDRGIGYHNLRQARSIIEGHPMLPFKLVYSNGYYLPIGAHVFPAEKYRRVHDRLLETGVADSNAFLEPEPATDQDILLVHTPEYVHKLKTGTLSPREEMELEVPYSRNLVAAFWLAAGGSILAARQALSDRVCINIGGGFHHAFPDHGEGFCMIHDVAVAIRCVQRDGKIRTAMTVDCDVHHGNGTAAIFAGTRTRSDLLPSVSTSRANQTHSKNKRETHAGDVFTVSLHQHNNYPAVKPPSSIDVDLPDGVGDDDYLAWLDNALSSGLRQFEPDLLCYIAGADPYREDQLGGLSLTMEGLKKRDELVFHVARARDIPVMVTFAGGYARRVEDTVTIHCNTVVAAQSAFERN